MTKKNRLVTGEIKQLILSNPELRSVISEVLRDELYFRAPLRDYVSLIESVSDYGARNVYHDFLLLEMSAANDLSDEEEEGFIVKFKKYGQKGAQLAKKLLLLDLGKLREHLINSLISQFSNHPVMGLPYSDDFIIAIKDVLFRDFDMTSAMLVGIATGQIKYEVVLAIYKENVKSEFVERLKRKKGKIPEKEFEEKIAVALSGYLGKARAEYMVKTELLSYNLFDIYFVEFMRHVSMLNGLQEFIQLIQQLLV